MNVSEEEQSWRDNNKKLLVNSLIGDNIIPPRNNSIHKDPLNSSKTSGAVIVMKIFNEVDGNFPLQNFSNSNHYICKEVNDILI